MIIVLVIASALALGVFHESATRAAVSTFDAVGRALIYFGGLTRSLQRLMFTWLKRDPSPSPLPLVLGFLVLAAEVPILVADYKVLRMSLTLVWPTDVPPLWLAVSVVTVTMVAGLLLHSINGRGGKLAMLLIVILLTSFQATVAWLRTSQLDEVQRIEMSRKAPATETGSLDIAGQQPSDLSPIPASEKPTEFAVPTHLLEDPPALLSALLAALLSLGSVAAAWGGVTLVEGGLARLAVLPILALLVLGNSIVQGLIEFQADAVVKDIAVSLLEALGKFFDWLSAALFTIMPPPWTSKAFEWSIERENRRDRSSDQRRSNASLAKIADAIRECVDQATRAGLAELVAVLANDRGPVFKEVVACARTKVREQVDAMASHVVKLWFAPLRRLLRLDKKVTSTVTGERSHSDNSKSEAL